MDNARADALAVLPLPVFGTRAQDRSVTVASIEQSGFFDHLLPGFPARTGIAVRVATVGTGQALEIGCLNIMREAFL